MLNELHTYTFKFDVEGADAAKRMAEIKTSMLSAISGLESPLKNASTATQELTTYQNALNKAVSSSTRRWLFHIKRLLEVVGTYQGMRTLINNELKGLETDNKDVFHYITESAQKAKYDLLGDPIIIDMVNAISEEMRRLEQSQYGTFEPLTQEAKEAQAFFDTWLDKSFGDPAYANPAIVKGAQQVTGSLRELELQAQSTKMPLGDLITTFSESINEATGTYYGLRRLGYGLQFMGGQLKGFGDDVLGFIGDAKDAYIELDNAVRVAAVAIDLNPDLYDDFLNQLKDLSVEMPSLPFDEITEGIRVWGAGMGEVAETQEDVARILETTTELQKASLMNAEQFSVVAEATGGILNEFNLRVDDTAMVVQILNSVAANTYATIADVGNAMKMVGPQAAFLGVSFEEAASALALLSNENIKGASAGRALNQVLRSISAPSQKADDAFNELFQSSLGLGETWRDLVFPNEQFIGLAGYVELLSKAMEGLTEAQIATFVAETTRASAMPTMIALIDQQMEANKRGINVIEAYNKAQLGVIDEEVVAYRELYEEITGLPFTVEDALTTMNDRWELYVDRDSERAAAVQKRWDNALTSVGKAGTRIVLPFLEAVSQIAGPLADAVETFPIALGLVAVGGSGLAIVGRAAQLIGNIATATSNVLIFRTAMSSLRLSVAAFAESVAAFNAGVAAEATSETAEDVLEVIAKRGGGAALVAGGGSAAAATTTGATLGSVALPVAAGAVLLALAAAFGLVANKVVDAVVADLKKKKFENLEGPYYGDTWLGIRQILDVDQLSGDLFDIVKAVFKGDSEARRQSWKEIQEDWASAVANLKDAGEGLREERRREFYAPEVNASIESYRDQWERSYLPRNEPERITYSDQDKDAVESWIDYLEDLGEAEQEAADKHVDLIDSTLENLKTVELDAQTERSELNQAFLDDTEKAEEEHAQDLLDLAEDYASDRIDIEKKYRDRLLDLQDDFRLRTQRNDEDHALELQDIHTKLQQEQLEADREYYKSVAELKESAELDEIRRLEDYALERQETTEAAQQDLREAERSFQDDLAKLREASDDTSQREQYLQELEDLEREHTQELEDLQQEHQQTEQQSREDHLERLRRLERDHSQAIVNLLEQRDVQALVQEMQSYRTRRSDAETDYAISRRRREADYASRREELVDAYEEDRQELRNSLEEESRLRREAAEEAIAELRAEYQEAAALRQQELQDTLTDMDAAFSLEKRRRAEDRELRLKELEEEYLEETQLRQEQAARKLQEEEEEYRRSEARRLEDYELKKTELEDSLTEELAARQAAYDQAVTDEETQYAETLSRLDTQLAEELAKVDAAEAEKRKAILDSFMQQQTDLETWLEEKKTALEQSVTDELNGIYEVATVEADVFAERLDELRNFMQEREDIILQSEEDVQRELDRYLQQQRDFREEDMRRYEEFLQNRPADEDLTAETSAMQLEAQVQAIPVQLQRSDLQAGQLTRAIPQGLPSRVTVEQSGWHFSGSMSSSDREWFAVTARREAEEALNRAQNLERSRRVAY